MFFANYFALYPNVLSCDQSVLPPSSFHISSFLALGVVLELSTLTPHPLYTETETEKQMRDRDTDRERQGDRVTWRRGREEKLVFSFVLPEIVG